jgi:ferredoxin
MQARIDADLCIGCGLCVSACEEVFKMEDDKVVVYVSVVPTEAEENCKKATEECPVTAIILS